MSPLVAARLSVYSHVSPYSVSIPPRQLALTSVCCQAQFVIRRISYLARAIPNLYQEPIRAKWKGGRLLLIDMGTILRQTHVDVEIHIRKGSFELPEIEVEVLRLLSILENLEKKRAKLAIVSSGLDVTKQVGSSSRFYSSE